MTRLRKPKPATDIPVPTLQQLTSQRDPRALAALSTAIAFPFGSPFYSTRDVSSDGATVRGRDTGWQTAYAAAKMAIEITKESSDLCPALKTVVGAMSVLIKNYDVSAFYS